MAEEAGSGDRRHIPAWNGNAAKWESFRGEIRVWRLGENLNVKCSLAARLVSGLSGPVRMTYMTMDADQLRPPPGDGLVATADERRNVAGLDNVMSVLQTSPLVKKLPARKNELLHAFFRDDSLARTKGEPIAMWLVRYNEQRGKLNRVGLYIVTSLPDVAGWQALNLVGLTEDRIERVVSWLLDDTFPLDTISAEVYRVFASVHMRACVFNSCDSSWSRLELKRTRTSPTKCASSSSLGTVQTHTCGRKKTKSLCFVRTVGHV